MVVVQVEVVEVWAEAPALAQGLAVGMGEVLQTQDAQIETSSLSALV